MSIDVGWVAPIIVISMGILGGFAGWWIIVWVWRWRRQEELTDILQESVAAGSRTLADLQHALVSFDAPDDGLLYCQLHDLWLDPPDATHRGHPELDPVNSGEDCGQAVDVGRAVRFWLSGGLG